MSSWTSLSVDGYSLCSTPSYAGNEELSLFREEDKHLRIRVMLDEQDLESPWLTVDEVDALPWRRDDDGWHLPADAVTAWTCDSSIDEVASVDADITEMPSHTTHRRSSRVDEDVSDRREGAVARPAAADVIPPEREAEADTDHLIRGHAYITTVTKAKDRLDAMGFTLVAAQQALEEHTAAVLAEISERQDANGSLPSYYRAEHEALSHLTFSSWRETFRWITARGAYAVSDQVEVHGTTGYYVAVNEATALCRYLLDRNAEHVYGFPYGDIRYFLRAAIDTCGDDALVELDLSEVTDAGYYEPLDKIVEPARAAAVAAFPADAPVIVLTEGHTDREALEAALGVLYPHLTDIYSFLDFRGMRVEGGAGPLAGMIKAFAGAGVANRIVAFFDNDTAAHSTLRGLRGLALPPNIRVLTFPDLPLARRYPTLGPGDLLDKRVLQERYLAKTTRALKEPAVVAEQDWSGMCPVLDALRHAFHLPASEPSS